MLNRWLYTHLPTVRQLLTRMSYEYVSILDKDEHVLLLNYGYADLNSGSRPIQLNPEDERHRYEVQLYHHLATTIPINWEGLDVLEVSSGRGGGACYLKNRFHPQSVTGVDFSRKAVSFCNQYYDTAGLSFVHGDAETLDFPAQSFDVIVNIEASFYYPHIKRFFNNVVRILKPDGYFLYADMRYAGEMKAWRKQLQAMGLQLLFEEDITANVVKAMALDRERREKLIQGYVPKILHRPFNHLWGITGAGLVNGDAEFGERLYMSFVLRKNGSPSW